jgi:glycosyltransferase involved in cell wall biosynthesis
MGNPPISAVVITLNEASNIARCIEALLLVVDEILIYDSFSTDNTPAICAQYPMVRFIQGEWKGFAQTKNIANALAQHDWILSIDADEVLDANLQQALLALRPMLNDSCAFAIRRLPFYCGYPVRYTSWNPDWKVRLFNRQFCYWEGQFVHEWLHVPDSIKTLKLSGHCLHYSFPTISAHLATIAKYAPLEAQRHVDAGKRITFFHLIIKPVAQFFTCYVLKQGFRDGRVGLIVSIMNSYAKFVRYACAWVILRKQAKDV